MFLWVQVFFIKVTDFILLSFFLQKPLLVLQLFKFCLNSFCSLFLFVYALLIVLLSIFLFHLKENLTSFRNLFKIGNLIHKFLLYILVYFSMSFRPYGDLMKSSLFLLILVFMQIDWFYFEGKDLRFCLKLFLQHAIKIFERFLS